MEYTIILVSVFILYITMREVTFSQERKQWVNERKDLYDRIMSKDLQEYKWNTEEVKVYEPVSRDDKELYEQEIEDNKQ